jgi:AcrR family transcriptional regulator
MLDVGSALIRKKGIRLITVEDITRGANIAKGSFYSFFKSREELFWEIIKREEQQLVDQIKSAAQEKIDLKTKVKKIMRNLFLADDCIVYYLSQADLEIIARKLPPEVIQADMENGQDVTRTLLSLCKMDASPESIETLTGMLRTLQFVASDTLLHTDATRKKLLEISVDAFADYLSECGEVQIQQSGG